MNLTWSDFIWMPLVVIESLIYNYNSNRKKKNPSWAHFSHPSKMPIPIPTTPINPARPRDKETGSASTATTSIFPSGRNAIAAKCKHDKITKDKMPTIYSINNTTTNPKKKTSLHSHKHKLYFHLRPPPNLFLFLPLVTRTTKSLPRSSQAKNSSQV